VARDALGLTPSLDGSVFARASDIAIFIAGHTDDERVESLARGLCSVQWNQVEFEAADGAELPALFAICRLALTRRSMSGIELPRTEGLITRLAAGDSIMASRIAERRLRGAGLVARCGPITTVPEMSHRIAAALLFSLVSSTLAAMRRRVVRTTSLEKLDHGSHRS
jgi:CRISPR-associated protein Csx17